MIDQNSVATLANYVNEFYNTTDERRRMELKQTLDSIQKDPNTWRVVAELIDPNLPQVVQFFGATVLHDALHRGFNQICEQPETTDYMKMYLVEKLTVGVKSFKQTLLNKLFSTTAVFMLHCLPDIWSDPLEDLAQIWVEQPELLLRVFTEVAVEFTRLSWELQVRGLLKLKISKDVLTDEDSSPSLRNAAVECVEMWLRLPGSNLEEFIPIFDVVFSNILNDCDALARILTNIKLNEGLAKNPQLFLNVANFLRIHVCTFLAQEMQNRVPTERNDELKEETEDICTLVNAMSEFIKNGLHKLVALAAKCCVAKEDLTSYNILIDLCTFFKYVATFSPCYSIGEYYSDLTEGFWSELMENLLVDGVTPEIDKQKKTIRLMLQQFFLEILISAVQKVAFLPNMNKITSLQSIEHFKEYRKNRSDVSLNAYKLTPKETITFLANALGECLRQKDLYKSEAVLYYLKQISDYMDEKDLLILISVLCQCHEVRLWGDELLAKNMAAFVRFGKILMECCRCLSHLVITSENHQEILPKVIEMSLFYLSVNRVDEECLLTIEQYIKEKEVGSVGVADTIIFSCYNYFCVEDKSPDFRLTSMRCVGHGLALKEKSFVLDSLNQILAPRLEILAKLINEENMDVEKRIKEIAFELGVIKELCATLHRKHGKRTKLENILIDLQEQSTSPDPVFILIQHCIPIFTQLLGKPYLKQEDDKLIEELCEILIQSILALQTIVEPFMDFFLELENSIIVNHPQSACKLLKNVCSVAFNKLSSSRSKILHVLSTWFQEEYFRLTTHLVNNKPMFSSRSHEYIEFAAHAVRKNWMSESFDPPLSTSEMVDVKNFLQAATLMSILYFDQSDDNITIREAFKMLANLFKNFSKNDSKLVHTILGEVGERLITSTYASIYKEYASQILVPIAEVLYYSMQSYPAESRHLIRQLPEGNSNLVTQLFNARDFRNFKLVLSKIMQTAMKSIASV